jgi:hypothetical protein
MARPARFRRRPPGGRLSLIVRRYTLVTVGKLIGELHPGVPAVGASP